MPDNDERTSRVQHLINIDSREAARRELDLLIESCEDTDCRKGWAFTRKGIIDLLDGKYDEALNSLKISAQGQVAVPRIEQVKAMRRVGWILHRQGRKAEAYKAYRELQEYSGSDYTKAVMDVECCGIIMEYAKEEKGDFEDARETIRNAVSVIDEKHKRERGTLELMNLEMYYYEEDYQTMLNLADEWLLKYSDQIRDKSMCLMFKGFALNKLGRHSESDAALEEILKLPDSEDPWDHFESGNQKAKVCYWLSVFAKRRGNEPLAKFWNSESEIYR